MIVCVFGGRDLGLLADKTYCPTTLAECFKHIRNTTKNLSKENLTFIDGEATGADTIGYLYAMTHQLPFKRYPAKWRVNGVYNPRAGFERNSVMLEVATYFIGFWDGESGGTNDMRKKVIKSGKPLRMFRYDAPTLPNLERMKEWET